MPALPFGKLSQYFRQQVFSIRNGMKSGVCGIFYLMCHNSLAGGAEWTLLFCLCQQNVLDHPYFSGRKSVNPDVQGIVHSLQEAHFISSNGIFLQISASAELQIKLIFIFLSPITKQNMLECKIWM